MCQEKENAQKLLEITSNKNCESQNVNNQLKNHINNLTVQNLFLLIFLYLYYFLHYRFRFYIH